MAEAKVQMDNMQDPSDLCCATMKRLVFGYNNSGMTQTLIPQNAQVTAACNPPRQHVADHQSVSLTEDAAEERPSRRR